MLSVFSVYGIEHVIRYNGAKRNIKYIHIPNFVLDNV